MVMCLIFGKLPLEQQGKPQKLVIKWDSFVLLPNKILHYCMEIQLVGICAIYIYVIYGVVLTATKKPKFESSLDHCPGFLLDFLCIHLPVTSKPVLPLT